MATVQHPVPETHLKAIGNIAVSFALLETLLASTLHLFIGAAQPIGHMVTAQLSFKRMVDLLGALIQARFKNHDELAEWTPLIKRLHRAEVERNIIMHSFWVAGNSQGTITCVKTTARSPQGLRHQFKTMRVEGLDNIAETLLRLTGDLIGLQARWAVREDLQPPAVRKIVEVIVAGMLRQSDKRLKQHTPSEDRRQPT